MQSRLCCSRAESSRPPREKPRRAPATSRRSRNASRNGSGGASRSGCGKGGGGLRVRAALAGVQEGRWICCDEVTGRGSPSACSSHFALSALIVLLPAWTGASVWAVFVPAWAILLCCSSGCRSENERSRDRSQNACGQAAAGTLTVWNSRCRGESQEHGDAR